MLPPQIVELARNEAGLFVPFGGEGASDAAGRVLALFPAAEIVISLDVLREAAQPITARTLRRALVALVQTRQIVRIARGQYRRTPAH